LTKRFETERLVIRPWQDDDVAGALEIFGSPVVARWLSPLMHPVTNAVTMRSLLHVWRVASEDPSPAAHWAIEHHDTRWLVGGLALLPLPPSGQDLSIVWQLAPAARGNGFATEAGSALVRAVLNGHDVDELFAVLRPDNARAAATAQRIGMEWVGETEKYYGTRLRVYRIRRSDLADASVPGRAAGHRSAGQ
jgi:RimJ/RimL family protein N-acetyltransferase